MASTPISVLLNSDQFKAALAEDPAGATAYLKDALASGAYHDDRGASGGRGGHLAPPGQPGFPPAASKALSLLKDTPSGLSQSLWQTLLGPLKAAGADVGPELAAVQPSTPGESFGKGLGDAGQLALLNYLTGGGAALARLGTIPRILGTGAASALESGALTNLQTGGDTQAAKRDATTAGITSTLLGGIGAAGRGIANWLVGTPFPAKTEIQKQVLEDVLRPKMLAGGKPPRIEDVVKAVEGESDTVVSNLENAVASAPRATNRWDLTPRLKEARQRFVFPETRVAPADPTNNNFFKYPVKADMAIMPNYRQAVADADAAMREFVNADPTRGGLSIKQIDAAKRHFEQTFKDKFASDKNARELVGDAYAGANRDFLHARPAAGGGTLKPYYDAAHEALTARDLAREGLQGTINVGGASLRGSDFRKALAGITAITSMANPAAAIPAALGGAVLAYPAKSGWALNKFSMIPSALAAPPAVRGMQTAIKPRKPADDKKKQ